MTVPTAVVAICLFRCSNISSFRNVREDALRAKGCNNLEDGGDQGFRNTPQNAVTERVWRILADFSGVICRRRVTRR